MNKNKYIILGLVILLFDQIIKFIVLNTPRLQEGVFIFGESFGIRTFLNQSFAWGINISNEHSLALMVLVMGILVWVWIKNSVHTLLLILSGAISNLIDRIIHGGVVDYIVVPWGGIINIADIIIFIGVVFLILNKPPNKKEF
jgi:signal peptidase II